MATNILTTKILLLNGTQADWESLKSYVLSKGEPAVEFVPAVGSASTTLTEVKVKIGDGFTTYEALPYVGGKTADDLAALVLRVNGLETRIETLETTVSELGNAVFQINATSLVDVDGTTEADKIVNYLTAQDAELVLKEGNIAIVKTVINEEYTTTDDNTVAAHDSYTGYVYNGSAFVAMDGNYNAENVILNEDLTYTANIGVKSVPSSGSGTIIAKGKSIEDVLKSILAERKAPSTTDPTVTLTSSNIGAKEVGTNIAVAYSFSTTSGSYTYDDSTGVTFSDAEATFNGETKTGTSGTFSSVQVTDTTSLSISGSIEQSEGIIPHDNLGDEYADGQIEAKSWTGLTRGTLSGYRAWFCGYKNGDNAIKNPDTGAADATLITGDQVRALGNSANGSWKSSMNVAQLQQMFFAAPAGKGYKPVVKDSKTTAPQTVLGPITVYVKGANNYMAVGDETTNGGMAYDVWYVNNTTAASGTATLNITKS